MGVQATFNWDAWEARFPELVPPVTQPMAEAYFAEATLFWANDGSGPVADVNQQLALLNLLTAHIAARNAVISGALPANLVGRITSASEGSVSVGVTLNVPPGSAEWFAQTRYGYDFWAATAGFRTMHYRPGPRRIFNPPIWGRTF